MRRGQIMNLTEKIFSAEHNKKRNENFDNLQLFLNEDGKKQPITNEQKEKLSEIMKKVNRDDNPKIKEVVKKEQQTSTDSLTLDDCCNIINFIANDSTLEAFIDKASEELQDGSKSEVIIYALTLFAEDYENLKYNK